MAVDGTGRLDSLVAQAAAHDGAAHAIATESGVLTYSELTSRVEEYARTISSCARHPVCTITAADPAEATVLMLAALAAGTAFSFVDPDEPVDRAHAMLSALGAEWVAIPASQVAAGWIPAWIDGAVEPVAVPGPTLGSPATMTPSHLAFVALTSGSTRGPRPVRQSHASFLQFLDWQRAHFGLSSSSRVAAWSPFSYDAAYCEIFGALIVGGTVVVPSREERRDPDLLASWLFREEVSWFQTTPSFLHLVARAAERLCLPLPPEIAVSGETLTGEVAHAVTSHFPGTRLTNLYGPTESVLATFHVVPPGTDPDDEIPIGTSIPGREVVVVGPPGADPSGSSPGEIVIVSDFLADGYADPADERGRFFEVRSSARRMRAFRTGDQGVWREDGALLFRGRRDGQAKIAGVRVEASEVEAVLSRHPLVRRCAVIVERSGRDRLHAHVERDRDAATDETDFLAWLASRLPPAFVPSRIWLHEALPTTHSGKIARTELGAMMAAEAGPQGGEERRAAEAYATHAWGDALGQPVRSRERSFLENGGDSLGLVELVSRLRDDGYDTVTAVDVADCASIDEFVTLLMQFGAAPTVGLRHHR